MKLKEYVIGMLYNRRSDEIVYSRALIFYCNDLFWASLDLKIRFVTFRLLNQVLHEINHCSKKLMHKSTLFRQHDNYKA